MPFEWGSLRDAVVKVAPAISKEEHRFQLQLLHVAAVGREVELAATDGHRLHVARCATRAEMTEDAEDLVPLAVAQELKSSVALRTIGRELRPVLRVGLHGSRLECTTRAGVGVVWRWQKQEGTFPDIARVLAPLKDTTSAEVDCKAWAAAVKALLPVAGDTQPQIRLTLTPA